MPIWSANVEPRVLRARCRACVAGEPLAFDIRNHDARIATTPACEYVCLTAGSELLRMDIIEGSMLRGDVRIEPALDMQRELAPQISAVRCLDRLLRGLPWDHPKDTRLARMVLALRVLDARAAGIRLRGIATGILGARDWLGDGDCEKSRIRRLVALANTLERGGVGGVFRRSV